MLTIEDLRQAIATAYQHCRPGGSALFAPDYVRENFEPSTSHGGHDGEGRGLRYLAWCWDPDPADTTFLVDYAYLLREQDGAVRVEHDRHVEGLFARDEWLRSFGAAGFHAELVTIQHSDVEHESQIFVARRP